jgi:hypothetical protein
MEPKKIRDGLVPKTSRPGVLGYGEKVRIIAPGELRVESFIIGGGMRAFLSEKVRP